MAGELGPVALVAIPTCKGLRLAVAGKAIGVLEAASSSVRRQTSGSTR